MEYLDVVDSSGNPTGKTKSRPDVHIDGDWHRTVHVWIMNSNGELLIQKRAPGVNHPNRWDISSAGHVTSGDTSISAAMRELEEELGLRVPVEEFKLLFTVSYVSPGTNLIKRDNELQDVYLVKKDLNIAALRLQASEVSEVKFIAVDDLERAIAEKTMDFVPHTEEYGKLFALLRKDFPGSQTVI